jgi:exo-beta-1,3-glucanase (GH17 family)
MQKFAVIALACLGLSGCVFSEGPWPIEGTGGFAEYLPITDKQLQALADRLDALRRRGAEKYAAGAFAEAWLLLTRCRRELAAGIVSDANTDIVQLERDIEAIEATLGRKSGEADRHMS